MVGFPLDVVDIIKTFKTERSSTFIYLYRYIAPHIMFVFCPFSLCCYFYYSLVTIFIIKKQPVLPSVSSKGTAARLPVAFDEVQSLALVKI